MRRLRSGSESCRQEGNIGCLPTLSSLEQKLAIILLRELARGTAVTNALLGERIGAGAAETEAVLSGSSLASSVERRADGAILGFLGLSMKPTLHELKVGNQILWAWCAIDCLYLPELLGQPASILSADPYDGTEIRLTIAGRQLQSLTPEGAVLSIVKPQARDCTSAFNVRRTMCDFTLFFASRPSAEYWAHDQSNHAALEILPVQEAFAQARRLNAMLFSDFQ